MRFSLRRSACSEPWVDDQFGTVAVIDKRGVVTWRRGHLGGVFPPGGRRRTKMRWCRACFRYTPGPAMSLIETRLGLDGPVLWATLICDDCRIGEEAESHRELYDALRHLRPAGSQSIVGLRGGAIVR